MLLSWHSYRYYPYERDLAFREVSALLKTDSAHDVNGGVELHGYEDAAPARHLTYFAGYVNGHGYQETLQTRLEGAARHGKNRQATRYSVHGLHEYKGKFNPQVAKAILNMFGIRPSQRVLDPFSGSGTTLVECAHRGAQGYGTDINPLAIYIANAKLCALKTPAATLKAILEKIEGRFKKTRHWAATLPEGERGQYLQSWFDPHILAIIEIVKDKINDVAGELSPIFLTLASNLLRDYSRQDPHDLRIRRRKSGLPETPFIHAFLAASEQFLDRLEATQSVLGIKERPGAAILRDITALNEKKFRRFFDAALTSPPYAMALPYIDTQRLSLVWLDLLPPDRIPGLESELIGSREFRGVNRQQVVANMQDNTAGLPDSESGFCVALQKAMGNEDGFRRQAVPTLLYRYFAAMQTSFTSIGAVLKQGAPFALIVGHNHTVLGGVRFDINTPAHLASIAQNVGWQVDEMIELQTYQRYGYHMNNAVGAETLLILRNQ
jgi:site-specific DNA-methyltransferase (cytosine-N4-specific)